MALSSRHREVAPVAAALYPHGDDGIAGDLHRFELSIACAQESLCAVMFLAVDKDLAVPVEHYPAEQTPVFVVTVNHQSDRRIIEEIAHALEHRTRAPLRLVVHGDVEGNLFDREAYRDDMGHCMCVGGGKVS